MGTCPRRAFAGPRSCMHMPVRLKLRPLHSDCFTRVHVADPLQGRFQGERGTAQRPHCLPREGSRRALGVVASGLRSETARWLWALDGSVANATSGAPDTRARRAGFPKTGNARDARPRLGHAAGQREAPRRLPFSALCGLKCKTRFRLLMRCPVVVFVLNRFVLDYKKRFEAKL